MSTETADAIRRTVRAIAVTVLLAGGSVAAWSLSTPLDGAVVASGLVVVDGNVKKVQHPVGGIVGTLNVVEGQAVKVGEIVVRLDDTATRANLGIVLNEHAAHRARLARLQSERDGRGAIAFPADLERKAETEPDIRQMLDGERAHFKARLIARTGQKQQLAERIQQTREEIAGLEDQRTALLGQLKLSQEDLKAHESLGKDLQRLPRITELQREIIKIQGAIGEIRAKIAQSLGRIAEFELQIGQLDRDTATEIAKESREAETKISELQERRIAADDQLKRVDIRAPATGTVHQLQVHTVGGVVAPGELMMTIVPSGQSLIVEARVATSERDSVKDGQRTRVRFPAFNQQTTPEFTGIVFRVSENAVQEPQTGVSYYVVGIRIAEAELAGNPALKLVPGMPAEVFIVVGARTFASYLMKPFSDQMERALREVK